MRQALHIFKKDVRALWFDALLMLVITAIFAWVHIEGSIMPQYLGVLVVLESIYLTAKVVLSEPVPGTDQFWLTRPYRWWSLLAAKLIFIVVFTHIPLFVARSLILSSAGFSIWEELPGLLWSQTLMFLCISLPVAALASMSTSLIPFVGVLIAVAAILVAVPYVPVLLRFIPAIRGTDLEWFPYAIFAVAVAVMGVVTTLLQYATRRTLHSRMLAAGLFAAGALGLLNVSFNVAWWGQLQLGDAADASKYEPVLSEHPYRPPRQSAARLRDGNRHVQLFMTFEGVEPDEELRFHRLTVSLRKDDLLIQTADVIPIRGSGRLANSLGADLILDSEDLLSEGTFVTIEGSVYLSIFRQTQPDVVIPDAGDVDVGDGLRCGLRESNLFSAVAYQVVCVSPLRRPAKIVTFGNTVLFQPSYSPFPADVRVEPLRVEEYPLRTHRSTDVLWLKTKDLIGHARKDFRFENVGLAGLSWP